MKTLVLILTSLISLSTFASGESNISDASVGQTFALKKDVIFNEGIKGVTLYTATKQYFSDRNEPMKVGFSCGLYRDEDAQVSSDFRRSVVKAGKYRVIRDPLDARAIIELTAYEKGKNSPGTYTLSFRCYTVHDYPLNDASIKLLHQEINYQASKLVDVQDDTTEPTPWP